MSDSDLAVANTCPKSRPAGHSPRAGNRPWRAPASVGVALVACAALVMAGCSSQSNQRNPSGGLSITVMGDYEAIATCVAAVDAKEKRSPPALRIQRDKRIATLERMAGEPKVAPYDITFMQQGVSTVQVVGRGSPAPDRATRSLEDLWPNVAICATNLTAP